MPIILQIEAESVEEAQKAIDDWASDIDMDDDLPMGTEDIDAAPNCEYNDEGARILYLPTIDELTENKDGSDDADDFNDGDPDFS